METFISWLQDFIVILKIFLPIGIVNALLVLYFLGSTFTPSRVVSTIFAPALIFFVSVTVSEIVIGSMSIFSGGDGLSGFIPAAILAFGIVCIGFYMLYKKILELSVKQTFISIAVMIITGGISLWFLG